MAWAPVSTGTPAAANYAAIAPAWPSHSAGNIGLAFAMSRAAAALDTPAGWTLLHSYDPGNLATYLYGKVATSGAESAPTFTPSGGSAGDTILGFIDVWSGGLDPLTGIVSTTPGDEQTGSSVANYDAHTPAHDNCLVLLIASAHDDAADPTPPGSFIKGNHANSALGGDAVLWYGYQIQTTAVEVPASSFTWSTSNNVNRTSILALRAAASGGLTIVPNLAAMSV